MVGERDGDVMLARALAQAIREVGRNLATDPRRVQGMVSDVLGVESRSRRAEIDAVVLAAEESIPEDLLANRVDVPTAVARLHERGLDTAVATFAVEVWRYALGMLAADAEPPSLTNSLEASTSQAITERGMASEPGPPVVSAEAMAVEAAPRRPGRTAVLLAASLAGIAAVVGALVLVGRDDDDNVAATATTEADLTTTEATETTETPQTTIATTETTATIETTTPATTVPATPATTLPATPATTVPPTSPTFGPGLLVVGQDVQPGLYTTPGPTDYGCYYERLSGLSGENADIITNFNAYGPVILEIVSTDVAFSSSGCQPWSPFTGGAPVATFTDGDWLIGQQIAPGRWSADGNDPDAEFCYWERASGLTHDFDEIIDLDVPEGATVVDIAPGDVRFTTTDCGTWTPVG